MPQDPLSDFDRIELSFNDDAKVTYTCGSGPGVVVMTEMPGITPAVARFARWVRDAGFTVWMPSLFGVDGAEPSVELATAALESACVRREFLAFAEGLPSPMVTWLRLLASHVHEECGGAGVGAIGMCFTGNFALSMMLESSVLAPVMSQPSLPLDDPGGTFMRPAELRAVAERLDRDDLTVKAYRFDGDPFCRRERFDAFESVLGDRLQTTVLADESAGPHGWVGVPHSVVTTSLIDEAGQPTAAARDDIIAFFSQRLLS